MTYSTVESSMIDLVGYEEKSSTLEVRFKVSGMVYHYFQVPKKIWKALLKADSKGKFMNMYIVDNYGYKKLDGEVLREKSRL